MIFYGAAALSKTWHGIFINTVTGETTVISNDAEAFRGFYEKNREEIWAGYGKTGLRVLKSALRQSPGGNRIFAYDIASGARGRLSGAERPAKAQITAGREDSPAESGQTGGDALLSLKRNLAAEIELFAMGREKYISRLRLLERYGLGPGFIGKPKAVIAAAGLILRRG